MPKSLVKRWEHAKYGKEKHLAKKYLESIKRDEMKISYKQLIEL
jgi:hypothetical protein